MYFKWIYRLLYISKNVARKLNNKGKGLNLQSEAT